jgi:hypothetical protein
MEKWICKTCGTQFPPSAQPPEAPYKFERLYGAWFERFVAQDAHNAVLRSAERYIRALQSVRL